MPDSTSDETAPICEQYLTWCHQQDVSKIIPNRKDHVCHLKTCEGDVGVTIQQEIGSAEC